MPKGEDGKNLLRFAEGFLNHRLENGKLKKRWVVFRGNPEEGHYQVAIFKTQKEKHTDALHVVSKATYVGTEKGGIYCNKANDVRAMYWAVMLKSATVIFQELPAKEIKKDEEITSIQDWYNALKAKFSMENWPVNPLRGVHGCDIKDGGDGAQPLTLYITKSRVGLVMTTPPLKCTDSWDLGEIKDCKANGNILSIYIEDAVRRDLGALGYHEAQLRMACVGDASRAKTVIDKLAPSMAANRGFGSNLGPPPVSGRYTPSPTSPRRMSHGSFGDNNYETSLGGGNGNRRPSLPVPERRNDMDPYSNPYDTDRRGNDMIGRPNNGRPSLPPVPPIPERPSERRSDIDPYSDPYETGRRGNDTTDTNRRPSLPPVPPVPERPGERRSDPGIRGYYDMTDNSRRSSLPPVPPVPERPSERRSDSDIDPYTAPYETGNSRRLSQPPAPPIPERPSETCRYMPMSCPDENGNGMTDNNGYLLSNPSSRSAYSSQVTS